ncbi:prepilin-type N-terminal cleavage/methylation domain-containing protein [Sphingobacterium shayense]|uniref:prepilin-type N-terminal cleavage/methylation domain-containing protein n=1 Tax=Sphingobacterium shayense TaxID=626343 RepID=UPI001555B972|nr:prepilin-type N-terminal cleavage/methylation domain-containing protein [Sphingobacterium shayense]NQD71732.1 prepilin-type N-terminal cleavage/methylation domain-containing protein [Sphingobacterium shayense]
MKSKLRFHAFTLLEITIALLIAAICLGIAFYVLSTFTKIGLAQQQDKQQDFTLHLFWHRMQKETLDAKSIRFTDNTLRLEQDSRWTTYDFLDSAVVRSQQDVSTDTLYGIVGTPIAVYMQKLSSDLVETFRFELQTDQGLYPFVLHKQYSAEELLHLSQTQQY